MAETWLAPSFCKTCQNCLRRVYVKQAEEYVKHGMHQISVKHARMAAACTNSHRCTCFFPRWVFTGHRWKPVLSSSFCKKWQQGLHKVSVKRAKYVQHGLHQVSIKHARAACTNSHRCTCPKAPPNPTQCHKRHTCHANATLMSPRATPAMQNEIDMSLRASATPATKSAAAPRATNGLQARHQIQHKRHACHAKRMLMC